MYTAFDNSGRVIFRPSAGVLEDAAAFITENQLLRTDLWERFVSMFKLGIDSENGGWRGEYFGKMMRGGCFMYRLTGDEKLYAALTEAVENILTAQREDGTISSYTAEKNFFGWDMWCRKYVLLGLYYYRGICRDEAMKARILDSAKAQLKVIMEKIGPEEEGKTPVTRTSHFWRGLNSSSILEPVMLYYNLTKDPELLGFAKYIVDNGGIEGDDIFRMARENKIDPYMYPVTKAYEMVSCMEGLLEYALATGSKELIDAVHNFGLRVLDSDYTVIGSGGTTHELFDHSSWRQSSMGVCDIAQETCVTVTFMKFFSRLYRETGDAAFANALETSFFNAYLGAINKKKLVEPRLFEQSSDLVPEFLPFDSYSPLTAGRRGRKIGGFMVMPGGHYYGCCACIGSLGAAVEGLSAVRSDEKTVYIDQYLSGKANVMLEDGTVVTLSITAGYPYDPEAEICIERIESADNRPAANGADITIAFRLPQWSDKYEITPRGEGAVVNDSCDGYVSVSKYFAAGEKLKIRFNAGISLLRPVVFGTEQVGDTLIVQDPDAEKRICLKYGPVVLSHELDIDADGRDVPLSAEFFTGSALKNASVIAGPERVEDGVKYNLSVVLTDGSGSEITFHDYASCGKDWSGPAFGAWFRAGTDR